MNILIASTFLPPFAGGAERVALDIYEGIRSKENVKLLSTSDYKDSIKVKYLRGLTIYYSTLGRSLMNNIIREYDINLIHSHMALPWGYVFKDFKVKKIITCHGSDVFPKKNFFLNKLILNAFKKTDTIVSPSKWLSEYIKETYNYSSTIIPNGIDTELFKPLNKKNESNIILFVGRFIDIKGVKLLLEVASELKDYEFWFVGTGPLSRLIKLKNTKNLGLKTKNELADLYNRATICVFPSQRENFPLVGIEAMASGAIVLATKMGFSEYVRDMHNGIIIDYNKNDIITKINLLMKDRSLMGKIKKNARNTAIEYDSKKMIKNYYDLYSSLV